MELSTECHVSRYRSMVELISYYTANSLKQSFSGLDMTLKFPFRDLSLVKAEYDFTPEKNDSNMLMFKSGDVRKIFSIELFTYKVF